MNRLEELAQIVCERTLTAAEITELELLLQDRVNQQRFVSLMDVHHGLVGLSPSPGDATETMAAIWRLEAREAKRTVDADTGGRPRSQHTRRFPSRPRRRPAPRTGRLAVVAAVCLLVVGLGVLLLRPAATMNPWRVLTGTLATDSRSSFTAGARLPLATELVAAESVELAHDDGIGITVQAGSRLSLDAPSTLHLHTGEALATVTGRRPFTIGTALATISVTGTRFRVMAEPGRCRLEVHAGTVTFASSRTVFCAADEWAEASLTPQGIEVRNGSLRPPPSTPAVPAVPAVPASPPPAPPAVLRIEAEHHTGQSGAAVVPGGSGEKVGWLADGDWLHFAAVVFPVGGSRFEINQSSMRGGRIEIRLDAIDGPLIGSIDVRRTGDWETFTTLAAPIPATTGTHDVFLVIRHDNAEPSLVDIDWIQIRPAAP